MLAPAQRDARGKKRAAARQQKKPKPEAVEAHQLADLINNRKATYRRATELLCEGVRICDRDGASLQETVAVAWHILCLWADA